MRIVSGRYRGMNLAEFQGDGIRPTADRVKESLFNILYDRIAGADVLDLFCGSGNLGIECLSRGANSVAFNDYSRDSLAVLKKNLAKLKGGERFRVSCLDYLGFLHADKGRYDVIFIDPPYRTEYGAAALNVIGERRLLKEGGVAVYERDRAFAGEIARLEKFDERKYGKTYLTFFKASSADNGDVGAEGTI